MKKNSVEKLLEIVDDLKEFTNKLDYNTSSYINQRLVKISPILKEELEILNKENSSIGCPKLMLITNNDVPEDLDMIDYVNEEIKKLVVKGYTISDYGILTNNLSPNNVCVYIKYVY